jgi:hypothetical protein
MLFIGRRHRAVKLHQFPVSVFQMQHARESELGGAERRLKLRSAKSPSGAAFRHREDTVGQLPRVSTAHLSHLLCPYERSLLTVPPPFRRVGAEPLESRLS